MTASLLFQKPGSNFLSDLINKNPKLHQDKKRRIF
jgi:hypothetical protein